MTLGEFRKQTKNMSDDLELEIYTERFNDSTQPTKLDFNTEGYIEFIIDDDRWGLVEREKINKAIEVITKLRNSCINMVTEEVSVANECYEQYANCYDECLKLLKEI